jgi:L,D-peptidoglycan transpeptidase YkuD (ErfK/YbiS/YcfS/YnhG family)
VSKFIRIIHVLAISPRAPEGLLRAGNLSMRCALGRSGLTKRKHEGDGATPRGCWKILGGFTRLKLVRSGVHLEPTQLDMGWCDAPDDPRYNRWVRLPYAASHERLWRDDHLYDIVIVLNHNTRPRLRYGGSAVFLHLTSDWRKPTAGCIAISLPDMRKLLPLVRTGTGILVH